MVQNCVEPVDARVTVPEEPSLAPLRSASRVARTDCEAIPQVCHFDRIHCPVLRNELLTYSLSVFKTFAVCSRVCFLDFCTPNSKRSRFSRYVEHFSCATGFRPGHHRAHRRSRAAESARGEGPSREGAPRESEKQFSCSTARNIRSITRFLARVICGKNVFSGKVHSGTDKKFFS